MYEPLIDEIDISRMYPPTVNDFEEFMELGRIENGNFNVVRKELLELFSFRFVTLTTEKGIARWESMLKLRPTRSESVETRRLKVLAKINNKLPYTWRKLHKMLNALLGEGNYELSLDHLKFELFVEVKKFIDPNGLLYLVSYLDEIIPMNIWLLYGIRVGEPKPKIASVATFGMTIEVTPYQMTELNIDSIKKVGMGIYSEKILEIYPKPKGV